MSELFVNTVFYFSYKIFNSIALHATPMIKLKNSNTHTAICLMQMRLQMGFRHGVRYRGVQGVHGPPRIKLGGPVIGLDPPDFFKNIKILCKNKRINNCFENSSLVVTVSNFSKFSEKFFIYSESFYFFLYSEFLNILTCIFSWILYDSIH